jgi:hypothetical protein
MSYTVDDFIRDTHQEIIANLTPEEPRAIVEAMPPEERLRGLGPDECLRGLGLDDRLRGLDPDEIRSLDPETREMLRRGMGKLK